MYHQRLYEIIYILLSRQKVTCQALAAYFEVSRHTIMRDMEALIAAGVPIYLEKGRKGGVHLFQNASPDPSAIAPEEQQAILASLQGLSTLSGEKGQALLEQLRALLKDAPAGFAVMDFGEWSQEAEEEEKFSRLQEGILNRRLIGFAYVDTYGRTVACRVEPLALWLEGGAWYLRGYCPARWGYRLYKLQRMSHVEVLAEGFALRPLLPEERGEKEVDGMVGLRLRIAGRRRERVYEEFEEGRIAVVEGGDFEVSVEYPEGEWLYDFLLSFGGDLQVLEPAYMRDRLKDLGQSIARLYGL